MVFTGKTFWVTGAASGMGRSVSIALADFSTHIIISDKDINGLKTTAGEIEKKGSTTRIEHLDMADSKSILNTVHSVLNDGEIISGLYHFAGVSQRSLVIETPLENDRRIMEINFFGIVALTKALLPHMIKNGGGQIAVASSLVGKFGFPYRSAYSASKHALHGFFETLLAENYKNNIRVSMLIGGRIQTNISKFAIDENGKEHGKMDPGQSKGISPEKAARQILKGLRKEKSEIPVGGRELIMLKIKRFLPGISNKLARTLKPM